MLRPIRGPERKDTVGFLLYPAGSGVRRTEALPGRGPVPGAFVTGGKWRRNGGNGAGKASEWLNILKTSSRRFYHLTVGKKIVN